jgi:hypothetical protein
MIQELLRKIFILFSATIVRYLMAFPMKHPQIRIAFPWTVLPTVNGCTVIARAMTKNLQVLAKQVDKVIAVEEGIVVEVVVEEGVVYK